MSVRTIGTMIGTATPSSLSGDPIQAGRKERSGFSGGGGGSKKSMLHVLPATERSTLARITG